MSKAPFRDSNLVDGVPFNWRYLVYPIAILLFVSLAGAAIYFYILNSRDDQEGQARTAFLKATTPEDKIKVADQFPGTDGAAQALLSAADDEYAKHDYAGALSTYNRVVHDYPNHDLHDSAQLGLASAQEATGKLDDALTNYLEVARKGATSPYAPFGYNAAIRIYEQRGDKAGERKALTEAAALDSSSPFSQEAAEKLKALSN